MFLWTKKYVTLAAFALLALTVCLCICIILALKKLLGAADSKLLLETNSSWMTQKNIQTLLQVTVNGLFFYVTWYLLLFFCFFFAFFFLFV